MITLGNKQSLGINLSQYHISFSRQDATTESKFISVQSIVLTGVPTSKKVIYISSYVFIGLFVYMILYCPLRYHNASFNLLSTYEKSIHLFQSCLFQRGFFTNRLSCRGLLECIILFKDKFFTQKAEQG